MSLMNQTERLEIVLQSIKTYQPAHNDIAIIIVEKVTQYLIESLNKTINTQDIYDEIEACFNLYNSFIQEKDIELDLIHENMYELVEIYLNKIVEEYYENTK